MSFEKIYDLWEPYNVRKKEQGYKLSNVEVSVTNKCNLRCQHCALGNKLVEEEGKAFTSKVIEELDAISSLETINITGGEPCFNIHIIKNRVLPLLEYAKSRKLKTQVNTNLTFDWKHYKEIVAYTDIFHISFNYTSLKDFQEVAFANYPYEVTEKKGEQLYKNLESNMKKLVELGKFVSAETILSSQNLEKITDIHQVLVNIGVQRHELQSLFPFGFAQKIVPPTIEEIMLALKKLLREKSKDTAILLGCPPFFECSKSLYRNFLRMFKTKKNVSIRNCPDGRTRFHLNAVSGDVSISDLVPLPPLGNIQNASLLSIYENWHEKQWEEHEMLSQYNCYCPEFECTGPCMAVALIYYPEKMFGTRGKCYV